MNSSGQPIRWIASNRLWTPQGLLQNPLVTLAADGSVLSVDICSDPDRQPFTEFYAGILVLRFPADFRTVFAGLLLDTQTPLPEVLAALITPDGGIPVVISGVDYTTLSLTPLAQIRRI